MIGICRSISLGKHFKKGLYPSLKLAHIILGIVGENLKIGSVKCFLNRLTNQKRLHIIGVTGIPGQIDNPVNRICLDQFFNQDKPLLVGTHAGTGNGQGFFSQGGKDRKSVV